MKIPSVISTFLGFKREPLFYLQILLNFKRRTLELALLTAHL